MTIWTRLLGTCDPLDAVINRKLANGKAACEKEGWRLKIWAADSYGALHPSARPLVGKLIKLLQARLPWKAPELVASEVWSALSAAVLARPASQLSRHAFLLQASCQAMPGGDVADVSDSDRAAEEESPPSLSGSLPLSSVLGTSTGASVQPDAAAIQRSGVVMVVDDDENPEISRDEAKAADSGTLGKSTGAYTPKPGAADQNLQAAAGGGGSTVADGAMAEMELPEPAMALDGQDAPRGAAGANGSELALRLRLPSGAVLPMRATTGSTLADLKDRVRQQLGWASAWPDFGLALGYAALVDERTLAGNDLASGDILTLYLREGSRPV